MRYIYVNDRINIVNSELNSPRFSEGNLIIIKYGIINNINNAWNVNSNGNFNNNYDNEAGVRLDYFDTLL